MMVELLAGALIGENFSFETAAKDNNDGGPPSGGEFIIAISPIKFLVKVGINMLMSFLVKCQLWMVLDFQVKEDIKID